MKRLVVHFDTQSFDVLGAFIPVIMKRLTLIFSCFIGLALGMAHSLLLASVFLLFYFFLLGLFIVIDYTYGSLKDGKPYMVLDEKGITMKWWGFIGWQEIKEVQIQTLQHGMTFIALRLHDIKKMLPRVGIMMKIGIWSIILLKRDYHIYIGNVDIPLEIIKQFIEMHL